MSEPVRVYIGGGTGAERADLSLRLQAAGWVVVGDPARADLVVVSPETWAGLQPRSRPSAEQSEVRETLTAREHEVLALVADGLLNREIAERLGVTEHTVKFHLGAIFGKLGAATRTEAVQRGLRLGIIDI
ncbi:MAG: response regulator transcription factor [Vicinamibacterales bacterium]